MKQEVHQEFIFKTNNPFFKRHVQKLDSFSLDLSSDLCQDPNYVK